MRLLLIALPFAALATPAMAQRNNVPDVPRELADPATADKLGRMAGALSRALLDLNVGEIEAAVQGRPVTPADRRRTVRDVAAGGDPAIERRIEEQAARSGVAIQSGMKAMAAALPAIMQSVERAADEIDRATANLPTPGYPRR
jgi:hypothetical protein